MNVKADFCVPIVLAALLSTTSSWAEEASALAQHQVVANFRDVDLVSLAKAVSQATGKTIAVDSTIHARLNLINKKPMTSSELYKMFLSVVAINEFRAIELGEMTLVLAASRK